MPETHQCEKMFLILVYFDCLCLKKFMLIRIRFASVMIGNALLPGKLFLQMPRRNPLLKFLSFFPIQILDRILVSSIIEIITLFQIHFFCIGSVIHMQNLKETGI